MDPESKLHKVIVYSIWASLVKNILHSYLLQNGKKSQQQANKNKKKNIEEEHILTYNKTNIKKKQKPN